jgi:hypothetical protein
MLLSKTNILQVTTRRTQDITSDVFGGDLRIQEITRAEYRAVYQAADIGNDKVSLDKLHAGFFALMVIDPQTGAPMFTEAEIMAFPERNALWNEIVRIQKAGLDLSETGGDFLPAPSSD